LAWSRLEVVKCARRRKRKVTTMRMLLCAVTLLTVTAPSAFAGFEGNIVLAPPGCEDQGQCVLQFDLRYTDPQGVVWMAAAKDKTDGASIPPWAQPLIGKPFDKSYIKAAVIHDHYCDRHVRPWRQTHRAFYDALVDQGLPVAKAKVMYFAVYLGGPKWVDLISGKSCGKNCIFKVDLDIAVGMASSKVTTVARPAEYDTPGFALAVSDTDKYIAERGGDVSLEELEARAKKLRPDDFYYLHGASVTLDELGPARQ
jgi:hypothetical protein